MLPNFEVVIGLENHVELKTKTKMFSAGPVSFAGVPNTQVHAIDLGYPGTLPAVNKQAVALGLVMAHALKMKIDPLLIFDRKNYFYPDLPKGFQITQQFHPLGRNGQLKIQVPETQESLVVKIERLHLEEDTAKQIHQGSKTFLDYNRSGIGLIEIVTEPVLKSAAQAVAYVEKLRELLCHLQISDAKMSEGSLRCDVNISLRPYGYQTYGTKVEIKNLNSLANVSKAIEFEIQRQTQLLLNNEAVLQETRRFDEATQTTIAMRTKAKALDYRYFPEPNLAPIQLDPQWIEQVLAAAPELPEVKRAFYRRQYGLKTADLDVLFANWELTNFFAETLKTTTAADQALHYLIGDLQSLLHKLNLNLTQSHLTPPIFASLLNYWQEGQLSSKHLKVLLPLLLTTSEPLESIMQRLQLRIIKDPILINQWITEALQANQELLQEYPNRPERVLKTIMGQLMKRSQGNLEPALAQKLLEQQISKSLKIQ